MADSLTILVISRLASASLPQIQLLSGKSVPTSIPGLVPNCILIEFSCCLSKVQSGLHTEFQKETGALSTARAGQEVTILLLVVFFATFLEQCVKRFNIIRKLEVFTKYILRASACYIVECMSCLVHGLHDLHGVWCVIQGWDAGTVGVSLSTPGQAPQSQVCAIHLTHPVRLFEQLFCLHCSLVWYQIRKNSPIFIGPHFGYGQYGLTLGLTHLTSSPSRHNGPNNARTPPCY